jgi:hypothetical protein
MEIVLILIVGMIIFIVVMMIVVGVLIKKGKKLLAQSPVLQQLADISREVNKPGSVQAAPAPQPVVEPAPEAVKVQRPLLPATCPACGGYMQVEEIKWLDQSTAQCPYCGKPVRGS